MLANLTYTLGTIFGIGFLIFIHELGHFLAARAVGIRVEAFSIGFGTRLFGFRRGDTDYKFCLIPLGGYVKMAGEDPTRPAQAPDEFGAKSVGARVLVISAGVIMNLLFALITIPIAFSIGVPFEAPVLGAVQTGGPAWTAGLEVGDRVITINGRPILSFEDVATDVAVTHGPLQLEYERGGERRTVTLEARDLSGRGVPEIGIGPTWERLRITADLTALPTTSDLERQAKERLLSLGLTGGEELLAVGGLEAKRVRSLDLLNAIDEAQLLGTPLELVVSSSSGPKTLKLEPLGKLGPNEDPSFEVGWRMEGPAWVHGLRADHPSPGLATDDQIVAVNGSPVSTVTAFESLVGEGTSPRLAQPDAPPYQNPKLTLSVVRSRVGVETLTLDLPSAKDRARWLATVAIGMAVKTILPIAGSPAESAGLLSGDELVRVGNLDKLTDKSIKTYVQSTGSESIAVTIRRGGVEQTVNVVPRPRERSLILPSGFIESPTLVREVRREPFLSSLVMGATNTVRTVERIAKTLRSLITGQVARRHMGGIYTIFSEVKRRTEFGFTRGLLFLAIVSINLAFLNILPIPVLDGGWLLFLIIEKVRGRPLSERLLGYLQWTGLALVLSLMVYANWNDVARLIGWNR